MTALDHLICNENGADGSSMLVAPYRVGVDVGGTFTDLVLVDARGEVRAFKSPSVPANPTKGVLAAVELAAQYLKGSPKTFLTNTNLFVHGSTIATNTLLEKKVPRLDCWSRKVFATRWKFVVQSERIFGTIVDHSHKF
ncbi:hydantoinase/oxoprolinase N-terminal domain-containing protein [Bradyrhizobium sp. ISRA463]|uniref:hydantoinase/oxoprolinase N-terminal domain-containing protein n=1 Tax=Bradyrhizobium sp. ISRA463 TaxID=2866199 RepID=UPI00247A888C|nr:hydantoinase/oxoprolinase N-terminal domain-containing protein [Bradyrhizobium sp. ISRA463]WGS19205.1 hypothetical protein MTX22_32975 [Bradyrhizobium sp. ISRA463]